MRCTCGFISVARYAVVPQGALTVRTSRQVNYSQETQSTWHPSITLTLSIVWSICVAVCIAFSQSHTGSVCTWVRVCVCFYLCVSLCVCTLCVSPSKKSVGGCVLESQWGHTDRTVEYSVWLRLKTFLSLKNLPIFSGDYNQTVFSDSALSNFVLFFWFLSPQSHKPPLICAIFFNVTMAMPTVQLFRECDL